MAITLRTRRLEKHADFASKIAHLRLPLAPLVNVSTGLPHPCFPGTVLQYWLLTEQQLDDLAHFYDQSTPNPFTLSYPCPIPWLPKRSHCENGDGDAKDEMRLKEASKRLRIKRRRWGRFMGLRGCETPVLEIDVEGRKRLLRERAKRRRNGRGDCARRPPS